MNLTSVSYLIGVLLVPVSLQCAFATVDDVSQSPANNFPSAEQLSQSKLEEKRKKYLAKRGWRLGYNKKPSGETFYIGWGESDIKVSPKDLSFPDARVIAFETALITAKGGFARLSQSTIATETTQRFFQDETDRPPVETIDHAFEQVGKKVLALGNASLDQLLIEQGVNPAGFTIQQKRDLARDSLKKNITITAVGNVSGLRPLVSFEDNQAVGVIVVFSDQLRQQANEIAKGGLVAFHQPIDGRLSIDEQINQFLPESKNYIFQHGVRVMKDQYGNIALVSFGQSGVKATAGAGKFQLNASLKAAKIAARSLAEGQLAEFINATINLSDSTVLSSSAAITEVIEGGQVSISESIRVGKVIDQFVKQNAKVKLSGITGLKKWTANHPDSGHLIVGEVAMWSPYTSDIAKKSRIQSGTKKHNAPKIKNSLRQSADFESDASF